MNFKYLKEGILDLFFPPPAECIFCKASLNNNEKFFCDTCWQEFLSWQQMPKCNGCNQPLKNSGFCPDCKEKRLSFGWLKSVGPYQGYLKETLLAFKFKKRKELAEPFALLLASLFEPEPEDLIVPVPMDKKKLKERGYNQAFLLARTLAQHTNLSLGDILLKEKGYADQIGLSKEERLRNLKGAFKTKKDKVQAAKGKRIILVDDVFTTGATAKECSDILMRAGAKEVGVLVVAVSLSSL